MFVTNKKPRVTSSFAIVPTFRTRLSTRCRRRDDSRE